MKRGRGVLKAGSAALKRNLSKRVRLRLSPTDLAARDPVTVRRQAARAERPADALPGSRGEVASNGLSRPLGLPLARQLLGFRDLRRGQALCNVISRFCSKFVALRGRQVEPHVGADVIPAKAVHVAKTALRTGVALFGGEAMPPRGLGPVLRAGGGVTLLLGGIQAR